MGYDFTYDWFSWNIPLFGKHLGSLRGTPINVVEIGSHEGRSTTWLLDNILTHDDARLICIDYHLQEKFWPNIEQTRARAKVEMMLGYSHRGLASLPADIYDFVYIDGSHWSCDVLEDAVLGFRRAKVGGVIAFDDYLWDDPKYNQHGCPKPAVDAFLQMYSHKLEVLDVAQQVWVRKISD